MGEIMKKDELNVVGSIFTLLVLSSMYLSTSYKQSLAIKKMKKSYDDSMIIIQELKKENDANKEELYKLKEDIKDVEVYIQIKDELRKYTIEEIAIGLAIAWTESNWNFNIIHNSDARGICGVIPDFWEDYLDSKNIDVNSVAACIEIYKFYKEENDGSRIKALKKYKGIQNNVHIINKTLKIRDKIYNILKESK